MRTPKDENGVVLIVVLAILALLCLIGITLVTNTRIERNAAVSVGAAAQARSLADSAFQYVIRDLCNDIADNDTNMVRDAYGEEVWFFYAGGNSYCKGGTISSFTGDTQMNVPGVDFSGAAGLYVQPNVNNPQTFLITTANNGSLVCETVRSGSSSIDLTDVASAGDQFQVFGGYRMYSGDTLEADCTGDGVPDAPWIEVDLGGRHTGRFGVYVRDFAGRLNANMVGNLGDDSAGAGSEVHEDGLGFDSYDLSLERLIRGLAPYTGGTDMRIPAAKCQEYAREIIKDRAGGTAVTGFGLTTEPPTNVAAGGTIDSVTDMGTYLLCEVTWTTAPSSPIPFLGRNGWKLDEGPTHTIVGNTYNTICVKDEGTTPAGNFTITQPAKFDAADSSSHASWSIYGDLDGEEVLKNSPYASDLEKAIVDAGHDGSTVDNDANGTVDDDGADLTGSGNNLDDDGDGTTDDNDEKYFLFEEWDMLRPHLAVWWPQVVGHGNSTQMTGAAPAKININSGSAADIDAALVSAGVADDTAEQLTANILAWLDSDCTPDKYSADGSDYYGVEPHLVINEIFYEEIATANPSSDDGYAVEFYNPFNCTITWSLGDYNFEGASVPAGSVGPGDYYILGNTNFTGTPDGTATFDLDDGGGNFESLELKLKSEDGSTLVTVDQARTISNQYEGDPGADVIPTDGGTSRTIERDDPLEDTWALHASGNTLGSDNTNFGTRTNDYAVSVGNRQFAGLGELSSLIDPAQLSGTDLVYTDDAEQDESLLWVPSDGDDIDPDNFLCVHDTGTADSRWFGRINVNTATKPVLMSLPCMAAFPDDGRMLADSIIQNRPYTDMYDLYHKMTTAANLASADSRDNDGDGTADEADEANGDIDYLDSDTTDNDLDGIVDEPQESLEYFLSRLGNVVTFRSDLFEVIVIAEVVDGNKNITMGKAQLRAIVDRSTADTGTAAEIIFRCWE